MRVESGKIFSILAHELRSPLGVIQGYIRMLRMRRTDDDPEAKMLTAMLDATGRISAVARQASELAQWHDGEMQAAQTAMPLRGLLDRVAAAHLPRPVSLDVPAALADHPVQTWQAEQLAAAIAAIVVSVERNAPDQDVAVRAEATAGGGAMILIGDPSALSERSADAADAADADRAGERLFGSGGQGLSLVLAAAVLDRHGIGVGLLESAPDIVVLRLPKD